MPTRIETGIFPDEAAELVRLATGHTIIEFGAWMGYSTVLLGQVARQVVSVDWHQGDEHAGQRDTLAIYFENLEAHRLREQVVTIIGRFEEVGPLLRPGAFEMGFLDGTHDKASTLRDLDLLDVLVTNVLAVHDYDRWLGDVRFEVSDAIAEWLPAHDWRLERVVNSLAVLVR